MWKVPLLKTVLTTLLLCTSSTPRVAGSLEVLIVNTVDGDFHGIDISTGESLWKIEGPSLISQSLSDLRLSSRNQDYSLVPSLEGQLYLLERNKSQNPSLKSLPLTVESLFSSHFMLTDNSILTGGKESSVFAFDPVSGMIKYTCSRDGCIQSDTDYRKEGDSGEPPKKSLILVYRMNHIIRAVHLPTGSESWNLSIRSNDLCLIHGRPAATTAVRQSAPSCTTPSTVGNKADEKSDEPVMNFELEFDLDEQVISAHSKLPYRDEIWSHKLSSRLAKSWLYRAEASSLQPIRLFSHDAAANILINNLDSKKFDFVIATPPLHQRYTLNSFLRSLYGRPSSVQRQSPSRACPSRDRLVYLGELDGQLYIQPEDGLDAPSPTHINFPKVAVQLPSHSSDPLPTESTDTAHDTDDEDGNDNTGTSLTNLIGYYRASHNSNPAETMCHQPFLDTEYYNTDSRSSSPTGLIPWSPDPFDSVLDGKDLPDYHDATENASSGDDTFSGWMLSGASDLLMLLIRANKILSDEQDSQTQDLRTPSVWHRLTLPVNLLLIASTAYLIGHLRGSDQTQPSEASITEQDDSGVHSSSTLSQPSSKDSNTVMTASPGYLSSPSNANDTTTTSVQDFHSFYERDFTFVRCLGHGGFGRVFEVYCPLDGCGYAIKRIEFDESREEEAKMLREVRALAYLDHPGIVRYYRAWFERPPPGWQEDRDRLLFGSTLEKSMGSCGSEDLSSSVSGIPLDNMSTSIKYTDTNITQDDSNKWNAYPSMLDDSLIVFEKDDKNQIASSSSDCTQNQSNTSHKIVPPSNAMMRANPSYLYIQMQLCSPLSLREWLENNNTNRPPRPRLYSMFQQIVEAVAYLHQKALMHRDLKPSNILFDLTDRLKLADFGLVTSLFDDDEVGGPNQLDLDPSAGDTGKGGEEDGVIKIRRARRSRPSVDSGRTHSLDSRRHTDHVGTDLYMSPEQEHGDSYDHKVDIFSLGIIFVELLIPFGTYMERIQILSDAKKQCLPPEFLRDHTDESTFVLSLLDTEPALRPPALQIISHRLFSKSST